MRTSSTHNTFAAFLRGINVGGNNPIKMDALRVALESAGFKNVKTILASGNVVFEAVSANESTIAKKIERCINDTFEKEVGVTVRLISSLQKMVEGNPFKRVKQDSSTKLYVTFLSREKTKHPEPPPLKGLLVAAFTPTEVFSAVTLSAGVGTLDLMGWLDKNYGNRVTTRTWGTIEKVLKAAHKEATT